MVLHRRAFPLLVLLCLLAATPAQAGPTEADERVDAFLDETASLFGPTEADIVRSLGAPRERQAMPFTSPHDDTPYEIITLTYDGMIVSLYSMDEGQRQFFHQIRITAGPACFARRICLGTPRERLTAALGAARGGGGQHLALRRHERLQRAGVHPGRPRRHRLHDLDRRGGLTPMRTPPPALRRRAAASWSDAFPATRPFFSPEETLVYGADASRRFAPPAAVVRPDDREQVRELLAFAQTERIPILPRGRATNTVGDCVPVAGGIVVSTARLARIREIDPDDFVAVVEPGVVTGDLQKALAPLRLFYAPDPASVKFSTIGGNAATCAGGMRAVKYGVTRDHILGIEAVVPGGAVIATGGRTHKNVVGLDLTRLLVGSEGTLGLFTSLTVKLLPLPAATATLALAYPSVDAALTAAADVFAAGLLPVAMELLAREAMDAVAKISAVPWPDAAGAVLFLRVDGSPAAVAADARLLAAATAKAGPVWSQAAATPEDEERLWELRRLLNPASFQAAPDKISDDVTVPRGKLREAAAGVAAIGREQRVRILLFGHIGDGNLHVNIMHDATDRDELSRALTARERILMLCLALRGTLSGEHGVGLSKLPFFDRQIDPAQRDIMRRIKAAFDPAGIMNPQKAY